MILRKSSTFQVMMMFALIAGGIIVSDLGSGSASKGEAEYGLDTLHNMESPYYKTEEKIIEKPVGNTEAVQETTGVPSYRVEEEIIQEPITKNGSNYNIEPERTDGLSSRITTVTESGQAPNYYSSTSGTTSNKTNNTTSGSLPTTSGSNIRIYVDGRTIQFTDAYPFIDANNRTLVPVRVVSENLGMTVTWDPDARKVGINNTMFLTIDSQYALVNGKTVTMDTKATIVGGRTYVPLRFVSENFGADVDWARNNLGGIDVFLNREGTQPQPTDDYSALEASLPKSNITESRYGLITIKEDVVRQYLEAASSTVKANDSNISFYLPNLPSGCNWYVYQGVKVKGVFSPRTITPSFKAGQMNYFPINFSSDVEYYILDFGFDRASSAEWCVSYSMIFHEISPNRNVKPEKRYDD